MAKCEGCREVHRGKVEVIVFKEAEGWRIDFERAKGTCYLCAFLIGFEAFAASRLERACGDE